MILESPLTAGESFCLGGKDAWVTLLSVKAGLELAWTCPSLVIYVCVCVCVCVREREMCVCACSVSWARPFAVPRPMDCSPPGSSVHRISQARILKQSFLLQGTFPTQGFESTSPASPTLQANFFFFFIAKLPGKPLELLGYVSSILSELPA